jgi:hypothetical protein
MYFGYWLSRQLGESRRQHALTLQALRHIQDAMAAATTTAAATNGHTAYAPPASPEPTPALAAAANGRRRRTPAPAAAEDRTGELAVPTLMVTARGSLMHRADCPVVTGRPGVKAVPATTSGYGYCTMCDAASVAQAEQPKSQQPSVEEHA